jgi:hypothetical protein
MSRPVTIICDGPGCGKTKQESNHWWVIGVKADSMLIAQASYDRPMDERYNVSDFCGRECALKFISERMGKMTNAE